MAEWILLIIVLLLICYYGKFVVEHLVLLYHVHKIPGPPTENIFLGNMKPLMSTREKGFKVARQWGLQFYPNYKVWIGHLAAFNILAPEDAAIVLSDTKHNTKSMVYGVLRRWLQSGLLTSGDEKWFQRRKILTPAFHFTILVDFLHVFHEKTTDLVERLNTEADKPHTKINEIITNFTLKVIGETAMGRKMEFNSAKEKAYENALHRLGEIIVHRVFRSYLLYDWIYMFTWNFFKEARIVKILHDFTKEVITAEEKRITASRGDKKKRLAMLDLLFMSKKDGIIDDDGIREEVDTFMFEGHDTISAAICFGLMLIACHPQAQNEMFEEMRAVLGDITKKPSYEELQELRYMDRCIKEILRLYPSVPYISRMLGEDIVTSSGFKLKKNTIAQVHIYDIHHNPDIYPDPEKFDPDRFLPENCKDRHPYAYIPFSAGPRNCIGQRFAMLEMKTVFCGILGKFVLEPVDTPETIALNIDIILRANEDIKVKFRPRVLS